MREREFKRQFWEELWSQEQINEPWTNREIPQELKLYLLNNPIGKKSVDIGCGLGEIALWLESKGYDSHGFDLSPSAIEKAKNQLPINSKVNFFVHDITTIPIKEKFDLFIDRGCFHDIPKSLQDNYVINIAESSNPEAELYLFIRAFRGDMNMVPKDEAKFKFNEIQKLFNHYFKVSKVRVCDLSPRGKEKTMPGLFFKLNRI